jgi:putative salt-induced outer membrane protein YdiY
MHWNSPIRASSILLALLAVSPPPAAAKAAIDQITIKDGSVLKGEIKRVENDELILDTEFADDVVIDVEHIVNIKSKQHFSVRLLTGEIISGFLTVSKGKIVLRERLPAPGEPKAADAAAQSDVEERSPKASPENFDPGLDEVVQQATPDDSQQGAATPELAKQADEQPSPTAETQLQQAKLDDLPRDEATAKIAEPTDSWSAEYHSNGESPDGRRFSFDDVDWIREKPTYFRYDADLNVGIQLARGNTDTTDVHFDTRFEPSFGWNTLRISGNYDKKTADDDTTTNRWKASLVYERNFRRRWFASVANTYESDAQRDLDLRAIVAAGVGYRFFDEDPTHLSLLPAVAYVNENFADDTDDTNYAALQLTSDFSRDLYKDDITFFNKIMYLNNLQSLSDIIIETRTGIGFDMPWDLVLTAEFETDWENEPAEDAKKLDTRYMLKIGFEFEGDELDWFK